MKKLLLVSFSILAVALGGRAISSASAADAVVYEPAPEVLISSYDWSGFYAGVHAGYGWAKSESDDLFAYDVEPEGWLGGLQAGYNHQFANNVVIGVEADVSLADLGDSRLFTDPIASTTAAAEIKATGTVRGRIGYAFDRVLPYVTAGIGWAVQDVDYHQDFGFGLFTDIDQTKTHVGWTVGAGLEGALSDRWTAKVEYLYSDLGSEEYTGTQNFGSFPADIDLSTQTVKIGLNYQFN
jgi:outer membrane immunogenic protein